MLPREVPYVGFLDYNDVYLRWYRSITRRIISPLSQSVPEDYEQQHYFHPTTADHALLLTNYTVNCYQQTQGMLQDLPDDVPLCHHNILWDMTLMSVQTLQQTRASDLAQRPSAI